MRILVADDQPVFRRLIEAALRKAGHEVVLAEDGQQAWELLTSQSLTPAAGRDPAAEDAGGEFDLAVLDWMMPGIDGPTLCRRIRGQRKARYIYLILLTAKDQLEDVINGLDAGADEYLVKPFNPEELRARVRAGGRIVDLERRLSLANLRLEMLASTDELTGLPNRRAILAHLEQAAYHCLRDAGRLSVIMLDLDGFKEVNDQYGHAAGDVVLREVAARLRPVLRPHHRLGRLGGDEFLAVLPSAAEQEAHGLAERMRRALVSRPCPLDHGVEAHIAAAFGVAEVEPAAGTDHALVLADQALYGAKARGGNCIGLASDLAAPAKAAAPSV